MTDLNSRIAARVELASLVKERMLEFRLNTMTWQKRPDLTRGLR
jgi:hypothetical protein